MASLFDAPNYESAKFPTPRPFQDTAHEALRQGVRDGHRCQMLMAPTGRASIAAPKVANEARSAVVSLPVGKKSTGKTSTAAVA